MPWEVRKSGDEYCVFNKQTGKKVSGGCHSKKSDAEQHMRALYANVPEASAAAALDVSHLAVIRDVEIMKTGIAYPLGTGLTTFTKEELADAVASQDDPGIVSPRLKLGHQDPRFNYDGSPALGKAVNLRLTDDGHTILADYVGVPKWFAGIMASAYPSRSVEGNWNIETQTGHKWKFVITACSLLGVTWPGITTLDDLPLLFSEGGPDGVMINGQPVEAVVAASADLQAAVNVDDVRQQYYDTRQVNSEWWWIRSIYLSPNELIVDDDAGQLYRVGFTVTGDEVTFDDPIPVKIVYEDVPAAAAAAAWIQGANAARGEHVAASYNTRDESRPSVAAQRGEGMDPAVLQALGLPEDADAAQVVAAIEAQKAQVVTEPPNTPDPNPEDKGAGNEQTATEPTAENVVQLAAKMGLKVVDDSTLKELQAGAQTAQTLAKERMEQRKSAVLASALDAGKFPPARKDHWSKLYDADPEGTEQVLGSLESGVIPISERGVAPQAESDGLADDAHLALFPDLAARAARQSVGGLPGSGQIINEREVVK